VVTDLLEELSARSERLLKLRAKLQARENVAGYEKNCEEIKAEIERLERRDL
jgi:hypothetical protein